MLHRTAACVRFALLLVLAASPALSQGLSVTYGTQGLSRLAYNGVVLEDLDRYPADAFHIWHMKMTDVRGNAVSTGQYGWGENNSGRTWNSSTHTWTYKFVWGSVSAQFVQHGDALDLVVTSANLSNSGVVLDGAVLYPLALHLPRAPQWLNGSSAGQVSSNIAGPGVMAASFGIGEVLSVLPNASQPLYFGFSPADSSNTFYPIVSRTAPDSLPPFEPHHEYPIPPGHTDTYTISLRFAPPGKSPVTLAADAYADWARTWPQQLRWPDRRPIGTVYLASSPSGPFDRPAGFPDNPRRFFNDPAGVDIRTATGLATFQARMLQQAADIVENLTRLGAQGAITWDIEGEEYPQSTSYVCQPDSLSSIAPEMESVVSDRASRYTGMHLVDAYFRTITDAGFRVGVCARPQHFTQRSDGTAQQASLSDQAVAAELIRKIRYAHDRWKATLFYVDSAVEANGAVLDASTFQQVARTFPDSLIIPEQTTPKHYAYTAAFQTFLFHGDLGTDPTIHAAYPKAFSANLINDVDPHKLSTAVAQLTTSVRGGDILMGHAGFWHPNNDTIVCLYQAARSSVSPGQASAVCAH